MSKKKNETGDSRDTAIRANRKRHKKRRMRKYTLYYVLLFLFVAITGIVLSLTVLFNIQTIDVTGIGEYDRETVIRTSGVEIGDNLFRINISAVRQTLLDTFDQADTVTVRRKLPTTLTIHIVQGKVKMNVLTKDGTYAYVSQSGRILQKDQVTPTEGALVVKGISSVPDRGEYLDRNGSDRLQLLTQLEKALKQNSFSSVTMIDLTKKNEIKIEYQNRISIAIGNATELDYKLSAARAVIQSEDPQARGEIRFMEDSDLIHFIPEHAPAPEPPAAQPPAQEPDAADEPADEPTDAAATDSADDSTDDSADAPAPDAAEDPAV